MHVIAYRRLTDPGAFRTRAEEPPTGRPPHSRLICSAPARDGTVCFSLWWADSAEALQDVLGRVVGSSGTVECHEVDEAEALGLEAWSARLAWTKPRFFSGSDRHGRLQHPWIGEPL